MDKREVYLNEYNVLMDNAVYLPLVSGLLAAYARTIPAIDSRYRFMPFNFMRAPLDELVATFVNPSVAAFSVSMWNMQLSLAVAARVKEKFPDCLVVFGGPDTPFRVGEFFAKNPFVDVTVRGEGEQTFADILTRFDESRDFSGIPGVAWLDASGECRVNEEERALPKDLDVFPSPYITGEFDYLLTAYPTIKFQAIIETNRGCPYMCSYCSWGQGGLSKKFRYFGVDRIKAEAEWFAKNKLLYIFCADSNFGIFKRDLEIAQIFVDAKAKYGYPEKFRVCYAKNAEDTVFAIGKLLHSKDMEKGITLSRQTNSPVASANVGRKNIKLDVYSNLQKKYNRENIPVYTELILGLPGESYQSFKDGIDEILSSGIKNQLFVYFCQVYPNTELNDPEYRKRHGIQTLRVPLTEIHGAIRPQTIETEYENIIVQTNAMSREDWRNMALLAWTMKLMHGLKLGFFVLSYLVDRMGLKHSQVFEKVLAQAGGQGVIAKVADEMRRIADSILVGNSCGVVRQEYGNIYWDVEEALFLDVIGQKDKFFDELSELFSNYLKALGKEFDRAEWDEVIAYQRAVMPNFTEGGEVKLVFEHNVPEYFATYFDDLPAPLAKKRQELTIKPFKDYKGDRKAYGMEVVVWGRKNNRTVKPSSWRDIS